MPVRKSFRSLVRPAVAVAFAFSLAASAGAAVITQTYNQSLDNGNTTSYSALTTRFDFNLDGTNDFAFTHTTTTPSLSPSNVADFNGRLTFDSATPSQFLAVVKDFDNATSGNSFSPIGNYAETLPFGSTVGGSGLAGFIQVSPGTTAYDNRLLDSMGTGNGGAFSVASGERNPLVPPNIAYVGFAFGNAANPNFGYLVFTDIGNDDRFAEGDRNAATLARVVYETTPGTPIVIGNVPEPVTLGAVTAAAGLLVLRRRKA